MKNGNKKIMKISIKQLCFKILVTVLLIWVLRVLANLIKDIITQKLNPITHLIWSYKAKAPNASTIHQSHALI